MLRITLRPAFPFDGVGPNLTWSLASFAHRQFVEPRRERGCRVLQSVCRQSLHVPTPMACSSSSACALGIQAIYSAPHLRLRPEGLGREPFSREKLKSYLKLKAVQLEIGGSRQHARPERGGSLVRQVGGREGLRGIGSKSRASNSIVNQ